MSGYASEWNGRSAGIPVAYRLFATAGGLCGCVYGVIAKFWLTAPSPYPNRYPDPPCRRFRNCTQAVFKLLPYG